MQKRTQPRPTHADLAAAAGKHVPDLIAPDLQILFCGINPSLYSAAVGHHFARPGNRFWPTLHAAGFTNRLLTPAEEQELLAQGYGITNLVDRATATAAELSAAELLAGREQLTKKVQAYRPRVLAVLGVSAYRTAFTQPKASMGRQRETINETPLWILPNPSGLNAHYQLADLAAVFREFRLALEGESG
ncbi:MAG: G/U mismatch-specific DNA glycosylase [Caldilineaceae bacterium]